MAKSFKDWSNQSQPDWAIIRQAGAYKVVPARDRVGNRIMVDRGSRYLPLTPKQMCSEYGPYDLQQARSVYANMKPRPLYAVREFYAQCRRPACRNDPAVCKGHDIAQGKWTVVRALLHFHDSQLKRKVNQVQLLKDGQEFGKWQRPTPDLNTYNVGVHHPSLRSSHFLISARNEEDASMRFWLEHPDFSSQHGYWLQITLYKKAEFASLGQSLAPQNTLRQGGCLNNRENIQMLEVKNEGYVE